MTPSPLPPLEFLNQCFHYEPWSGRLYWRQRPVEHFTGDGKRSAQWSANRWNSAYAGRLALSSVMSKGYLSGRLNARPVLAHRVIWKIGYGSEPEIIDHKNRDKSDNRIINLRGADRQLNARNVGLYRTNTSGFAGVAQRRGGGFSARICDNSGKRRTKWFPTLVEAAAWRSEMEKQYGFPPERAA